MSIVNTYDETIDKLIPLIRNLSEYPKRYNGKHPELHHFFDRALNGALAQQDLTIGLKHLVVNLKEQNKPIEANYSARAMVVTAYDILDNSGRLLGKEVIGFVKKHIPSSNHYAEATKYS